MFELAPKPTYSLEPIQFERLLDSEEAASLLGIHPKTLQRMARQGSINGVQIGKTVAFPRLGPERLARTQDGLVGTYA